jgi:hypothetical protein
MTSRPGTRVPGLFGFGGLDFGCWMLDVRLVGWWLGPGFSVAGVADGSFGYLAASRGEPGRLGSQWAVAPSLTNL